MSELLARDLGELLLREADATRKFKKGMFVRTSGMLQQGYTDKIDAAMVTGCNEALAVGGKIVPVLGDVECVKAELRTDRGELGVETFNGGDAYLCFEARRVLYRDGFGALGALTLDETQLRVLEIRNVLETYGGSAFRYQCDAMFIKGSLQMQEEARVRFGHSFREVSS